MQSHFFFSGNGSLIEALLPNRDGSFSKVKLQRRFIGDFCGGKSDKLITGRFDRNWKKDFMCMPSDGKQPQSFIFN